MASRLGNILYWAGCLLAAGWVVLAYFGTTTQAQPDWSFFWTAGLIPAAAFWLVGRAARYLLAAN